MRALLIITALLALGGCAADRDAAMPNSVNGDVASYDAMRQASQACAAGGGRLELRRGGAAESVSDYVCRQGASR